MSEVGEILKKNGFGPRLLLTADEQTLAAADGIEASLSGFTIVRHIWPSIRVATMQDVKKIESYFDRVDGVLAVGMQGNTVVYRASTQDAQGMTQYQDYTLTIRRAPTLKELRVTEENGSAAALEKFDESTKSYTWLVLGQQVTLTLIPTETEGYELYVDGENVTETGSCTVLLEETEKTVTVELKAGGETTQYTLLLRRTDSCVVRIPVDSADMEMTVCDENGKTVSGTFYAAAKQYRFTLIPGRRYTYTATKDTYYHVTESFVAAEKTLPRVSVQTGTWLTELALGKDSLAASKGSIALDQTFDPTVHAYTAAVPDTPAAVYLCIDGDVQTAKHKIPCAIPYHHLHGAGRSAAGEDNHL